MSNVQHKPGDICIYNRMPATSQLQVIEFLGATPVFIDIDPATYNMDSSDLANTIKNIKKKILLQTFQNLKKKTKLI